MSYQIRPASLSGLLPSSPAPLVSGWRLHKSIDRKEKFPVPSEKEEWGIIAQRLQTLVWSDKCYRDRGDGYTTLRMHSILLQSIQYTYRFKRVERLTNLPSDILTHKHARSQASIKTLWTSRRCVALKMMCLPF